jgi:hypothetical protein
VMICVHQVEKRGYSWCLGVRLHIGPGSNTHILFYRRLVHRRALGEKLLAALAKSQGEMMLSGLRFLAWVQEHEGARCPLLVVVLY